MSRALRNLNTDIQFLQPVIFPENVWRFYQNSQTEIHYPILGIIIQQIVTLSKYGHDALDICHP